MISLLCSLILLNIMTICILKYLSVYQSIKDKDCIYPDNNIENKTFGKCILFTQCEFNITNGTYMLISDQIMLLPTTYMNEYNGTKCPRYYDLPGYKYFNRYNQYNRGYGYCEIPFNIDCSQIMYNYIISQTSTLEHSAKLYFYRSKQNNKEYFKYAKLDEAGSNCPTNIDMNCVYYIGIYDKLLYLLLISLFIQIIIHIYKTYIYKKQVYIKIERKQNDILQESV